MEGHPNETYFQILLSLDYPSLMNYCSVNSVISSICSDEYFWSQKLLQDYPQLLNSKPEDLTFANYYRKIYSLPSVEEYIQNNRFFEPYALRYYGFDVPPEKFDLVYNVLKRTYDDYEFEDLWDPFDEEEPEWGIEMYFRDLVYDAVRTEDPEILNFVLKTVFDRFRGPHDYSDIFLLYKAFQQATRQQDVKMINLLLKYYIPSDLTAQIGNYDLESMKNVVQTYPELSTILLFEKGPQWEQENPEKASFLRSVMPWTYRYNSSGSLPLLVWMRDLVSGYRPDRISEYQERIEYAKNYINPTIAAQF